MKTKLTILSLISAALFAFASVGSHFVLVSSSGLTQQRNVCPSGDDYTRLTRKLNQEPPIVAQLSKDAPTLQQSLKWQLAQPWPLPYGPVPGAAEAAFDKEKFEEKLEPPRRIVEERFDSINPSPEVRAWPGSNGTDNYIVNERGVLRVTNRAETLKPSEIRKGKDYALIFATDEYDSWPHLANPINDARTIAEELESSYGFETEVIKNPTQIEIYSGLRKYLEKRYSEGDQLFIFFAGHGIFDETIKEGYIVAKNSDFKDEFKVSYISHSVLRNMIDNIPCKHILLVLDICFGGTFDEFIAKSRGEESVYKEATKAEFIERRMKFKTRRFLTSGGKEYVPDGRPGQSSPFVHKFLEALRSYGGKDNRNLLTFIDILKYVEKVNPEPRYGEFGGNQPGSDFIFFSKSRSMF